MSAAAQRVWISSRCTRLMRCALAALALATALPAIAPSQNAPEQRAPQSLSLDDVVQLVRSKMSEEIIVTRIKRNARPFDLSTQELLELKRDGISETIMKYLLDPSLPYTPPPPPPPVTPAPPPGAPEKKYPADKFAAKVPPDPGVYFMQKGEAARVELKVLVPAKSGGLGKLSGGLLKSKPVGLLLGEEAKLRVAGPVAVFHARLAPTGSIEEIALLAMEQKGKNRELEFAPAKGKDAKPSPDVASMRQFEAVEVGPKLYRITVPGLAEGEYLFYLIGSADPQKSIQGKGYDFGVD